MGRQRGAPRRQPHEHPHSVRLIHTSDVHIGGTFSANDELKDDALRMMRVMARVVRDQAVDLVLIAGDFFDTPRVGERLVAASGEALGEAGVPVVILPGNHDPYMPESAYVRFARHFPPNVHILQSNHGELLTLADPGVQVWGQAHTSWDDFQPASNPPDWNDASTHPHWRIAMAHGYYVGADIWPRYSYKIQPEELTALDAHYVALGHIELHRSVGPQTHTAYYSGAPIRNGGFALVDLRPDGIQVRHSLHAVPAD